MSDLSPVADVMAYPRPPVRSWTIEVCATCDRLATYPFCEHRPTTWTDSTAARWTETVVVSTRAKKRGPRG